ncbi:hypothetical protein DFP72DRAFT_704 [Ephemerocybe angulata]|uniref:Uncharacterized protein n=1 Tax=Ephemerocybe angulata TaxID=980116 RepID=A0A8H6MGM3_9AGAR|nr:hypothetical protein DFP72DRAFT_704 [Tulosesus angulatus]
MASAEAGQASEVIDLTALSDSSDGERDGRDDDEGDSEDGSDVSEVEIHLNEETRGQLCKAIATVSEARLRHVLENLIRTDQAVEIALTREFVTVRRETRHVVPRWEQCVNCDEEYDVNREREEDECQYHPGDMEPDEDGFADWDEDCHGPQDTPENRRQYPQEFMWTCCEEDGTSPGCVIGEHEAAVVTKKRKRD